MSIGISERLKVGGKLVENDELAHTFLEHGTSSYGRHASAPVNSFTGLQCL